MMNGEMHVGEAQLFDGIHPVGRAAALSLDRGSLCIRLKADDPAVDGLERRAAVGDVKVTPPMGRMPRFITLPDGPQLLVVDAPWLSRLPQDGKTESKVAWLEERPLIAVICIAVLAAMGIGAYIFGIPAAANWAAKAIPVEYEVAIGRDALEKIDAADRLFGATGIALQAQHSIQERFKELTGDLSMAPYYELQFRNAPAFGPNAFALPGGVILVTDALVDLCETEEEIVGVLAHEIGHVEHHHALRQLLRSTGLGLFATGITGDISGIASLSVGIPLVLAEAKYSREFERDADDFGFMLLEKHGLSPMDLAKALERISDHVKSEKYALEDATFLSTHPATEERIERARAAME